MSFFFRHIIDSLLKDSFTLIKYIWTKYNELVLNINTTPDFPLDSIVNADGAHLRGEFSDKSKHNDNIRYESPDYWCIRKIARILRACDEANTVFYDLGSGKGRILCVMAQNPFKKVVGVELFEKLCEIAKQNAICMRGRKAPIEIICGDAALTDLSEGTVYFMFHPFGPDTLRDVIVNIKNSLLRNPRRIIIVYYNAIHEDILKSCEWLQMFYLFYTATGRRVSFWRNHSVS